MPSTSSAPDAPMAALINKPAESHAMPESAATRTLARKPSEAPSVVFDGVLDHVLRTSCHYADSSVYSHVFCGFSSNPRTFRS